MAAILGGLLIFLCRLTDVTMGTMRILLMIRGRKVIAGVIGFFEVAVFLFAISQVVNNMDSVWKFLGYCGGFTAGTILGGHIDQRLAMGNQVLTVFAPKTWNLIAGELRDAGFGVTEFDGWGKDGAVTMVRAVVKRRFLPHALDIINKLEPDAFVTASEISTARHGYLSHVKRK
ncbi:MAG: DUF5698 domain-containing protein [Candidatus Alcyoniella australis]|nr:DUF5698 domain-containing protein [Candidatus Alcyoniella australis]